MQSGLFPNYQEFSNRSQVSSLPVADSNVQKVKTDLLEKHIKPLLKVMDESMGVIFLNTAPVCIKLASISRSPDTVFIKTALDIFDKLIKLQKVCLEIIANPERALANDLLYSLVNPNGEHSAYSSWLEIDNLLTEMAKAPDLEKIKEANQKFLSIIEAAKEFCTLNVRPVDPKTKFAEAYLTGLSLGSCEGIAMIAAKLPVFYDKEHFMSECINHLSRPAPDAIGYFKRFLLNIDMATLIAIKLINQVGQNVLTSNTKFAPALRQINELINLSFELALDNENIPINIILNLTTFHQKNLFALTFNADALINKLTCSRTRNLSKLERSVMLMDLGLEFLIVHNKFKTLITQLSKHAKEEELTIPDPLQYMQTLISETKGFFKLDVIVAQINLIRADKINRAMLEAQFFQRLYENLMNAFLLMDAILNNTVISKELLDAFDFRFNDVNELQVEENDIDEKSQGISAELIDKNSLADFLNTPVNKENPQLLKQNMLSIEYLLVSIDYCMNYAEQNAIHEARLIRLNNEILGINQCPAKKAKKPQTDAGKPKETQEEIDKKAYLSLRQKVTENVKENKRVTAAVKELILHHSEFSATFDELAAQAQSLPAALQLSEYSADNLAQLTEAKQNLTDLQKKLETLLENIKLVDNQRLKERDNFLAIHRQVVADYNLHRQKLYEAETTFEMLEKKTPTPRKGKTEKPTYPDFIQAFADIKSKTEAVSAALVNKNYSAANLTIVNEAQNKLKLLVDGLAVLSTRINATRNYFLGGSRNSLHSPSSRQNGTRHETNGVIQPLSPGYRPRQT
ncbi:MAG: hypothetical protein V4501_03950 [Pseudomonadota bacterium]